MGAMHTAALQTDLLSTTFCTESKAADSACVYTQPASAAASGLVRPGTAWCCLQALPKEAALAKHTILFAATLAGAPSGKQQHL